MDKRGQFYIIISILLSFALFSITYATNTIAEPIVYSNFNEVSRNYIYESSNLINNLLSLKNENIKNEVNEFTINFLSYAKSRDPTFQMIYFYSEDETVYLQNTYNDQTLEVDGESILGGEENIIQDVTLEVAGIDFVHQVPVTASNFGKDWVTQTTEWGNDIKLMLGGIIYPIHLNQNDFRVILRSTTGEYTSQMSNE